MPDQWHIEPLDKRAVCQKRRRTALGTPQSLNNLPSEWRDLLARWAQRGGNSRWETLRSDSGVTSVQMANDLLDWLLNNGWAAVTEQRKLSSWWPNKVELLYMPQLRVALGLRDKESDAQRWVDIRAELAETLDSSLYPALLALDELPSARSLSRCDLIFSLQRWRQAQKSGTRRDFSLFSRDDTKSVSDAEWSWLESIFDLAEFGIERHTPLLLIAAPLRLKTLQGQIDLNACIDFAALTPASVASISEAAGTIKFWHLVENRTSFERVARQRAPDVGVIWLPGFPPTWWRDAVGHLLDLAPSPAMLSCDPDPAGIYIAFKAAELWTERSLEWQPWKMSATDLSSMRVRKPLSDGDRQQLDVLLQTQLPEEFSGLVAWMLEHNEKGEQEGYL